MYCGHAPFRVRAAITSLPGYGGQAERRPAGQRFVPAGGVQPHGHVAVVVVERVARGPALVRLPQQRRDGSFVVARERPAPGQAGHAAPAARGRAARPGSRPASLLLRSTSETTADGWLATRARPIVRARVCARYRVHRGRVHRPLPRLVVDGRVPAATADVPWFSVVVHRPRLVRPTILHGRPGAARPTTGCSRRRPAQTRQTYMTL